MLRMAGFSKKPSYPTILKQIRTGPLSEVYFFYGEEIFLGERLKDAVIMKALGTLKDDFNLQVFYGKDAAMGDVINAASGFPVMSDRKVVVVKDLDAFSKADKDALLHYTARPSDTTCLILMAVKADFRLSFYKTLAEHAVTVEVQKPDENEWQDWIEHFITEKEKRIDPHAAFLLASRLEISLQDLYGEIEKIVTYIGDRPVITDADVEAVIGLSRQYNAFQLADAVGEKDLGKALAIFRRMLANGEEPVGIIIMLFRHFNILWVIRDMSQAGDAPADIERTLKEQWNIWPQLYRQNYLPQARQFTLTHIHQAMNHLLRADIELKSGGIEPSVVMERLLFQLIHNKPE